MQWLSPHPPPETPSHREGSRGAQDRDTLVSVAGATLSGLGLPNSPLGSTRPRAGGPAPPALQTAPSLSPPCGQRWAQSCPGSLRVTFACDAPGSRSHVLSCGRPSMTTQLKTNLRGIARPSSSSLKSPSNLVCSAQRCVTYPWACGMSLPPQIRAQAGPSPGPRGVPRAVQGAGVQHASSAGLRTPLPPWARAEALS